MSYNVLFHVVNRGTALIFLFSWHVIIIIVNNAINPLTEISTF